MVQYRFLVHTSAIKNAGTDSSITVTLNGSAGSAVVNIPGHGSNWLETNTYSTFERDASDVGNLHSIGVRSSHSGAGPDWHLDHIKVQRSDTGATWFFPCRQLIDDTIERLLPAATVFEDIPVFLQQAGRLISPLQREIPSEKITVEETLETTKAK